MQIEFILNLLLAPIKYLPFRSEFIERKLDISMGITDFNYVMGACENNNNKIGEYYYWYFQKKLIAAHVRFSDRVKILKIAKKMDRTEYGDFDKLSSIKRGIIIAIPHYGHYIASIISIIEKIRKNRKVYVFYGDPSTHRGNEVFDLLTRSLFPSSDMGVHMLHSTRGGMACALKALKNGSVVFIMPDVFSHLENTFSIPFIDRQLNVMLGTAIMARKTNSIIIPTISIPHQSLRFNTKFGCQIETQEKLQRIPRNTLNDNFSDYITTLKIFKFYEKSIKNNLIYWQYIRQHMRKKQGFPHLQPETFFDVFEKLIADSRTTASASKIIPID